MASLEQYYKGKVIIVTGGTSGIGRELVLQLAEYGAVLYICGRNPRPGEDLVAELSSKGVMCEFRSVDVQDPAAVEDFVTFVLKGQRRIDILFHCAGVILGGEIRDHGISDIDKVLKTNVLGTAYVSYYVYRKMAEQGNGQIINVGSGAGLFPVPLMGVYSASKFAVLGFTEALRMEARGLGVRVSTVAPGFVNTPIYDKGTYSKTSKDKAKSLIKRRPIIISPEEAAQRILRGAMRNKAVIQTQDYVRANWLFYRFMPHGFRFVNMRVMGPYRSKLRKPK